MPKGVFKNPTERGRRISLALKGKGYGFKKGHKRIPNSHTFKKGNQIFLGRKHSEQAKKKMRDIRLGIIPKYIPSMMGKKHTEATRIKMSLSARKGEKNNLWRGGLTIINDKIRHSVEYKLWRKAVYERDNYTCQRCNDRKGGNLIAHHIRNFAQVIELRTSVENGITFCRTCHELFHKIYGRKNNTREQINIFIN